MIRDSIACPVCNHEPALNRCWECGWILGEEACTTDTTPPNRDRQSPPDPRTEAEVQLAIRRLAELLGYTVYDLSQGRPTRQPSGVPDLYLHGHGRRAWIECKRPEGGRLSDAQREFIARENGNGGTAFVARTEADFMEWHEGRNG